MAFRVQKRSNPRVTMTVIAEEYVGNNKFYVDEVGILYLAELWEPIPIVEPKPKHFWIKHNNSVITAKVLGVTMASNHSDADYSLKQYYYDKNGTLYLAEKWTPIPESDVDTKHESIYSVTKEAMFEVGKPYHNFGVY